MVDGGYTATELKAAQYSAEELKEVSFSAGALRVAGFTSKQLQDALYSLRDMQRGGYPWKDLVIFLRATCAELTHAGYTHLDPKHRLFLEYRYEPLAEEAPPVSPRGGGAHLAAARGPALSSPRREYPWREDDPRSMHVGEAPLVMRAAFDVGSERLREVPAGTAVEVLELRQGEGALVRARIRFLAKGPFWWFSEGYKEGWVTSVQDSGNHLLVAPGGGGGAAGAQSPPQVTPARLPPPGFSQPRGDLEV